MSSSSIDVAPDVVGQTTPSSVRPVAVQTLNSLDYQEIVSGIATVPCDYVALTYVAAGNGAGEIETVTFKVGGAAGTTIATLTLTYDASNNLSTVTRT